MATAALLRSLCRRELHATSVSAYKSLSTNGKTSLIGKLGILARPFSSRPLWKGAFVDAFLMKMKKKRDLLLNKKIWSRRSSILPEFIDTSVRIYNGKTFVRAKITEGKVGHKFGEFAFTRKLRPKTNVGPGKKKGK